MGILKPLTDAEIREEFTNYGWFGLCPIYLSMDNGGVSMCERNGVPEFWMAINSAVIWFALLVVTIIAPDVEPGFPVYVGPAIGGTADV